MIKTLAQFYLVLFIATFSITTFADGTCQPIKRLTFDKRIRSKVLAETITQQGNYCLNQDIITPRAYDFEGERGGGDNVLTIESSNVNINLQQKMIYGEERGTGAVTTSWHEKDTPYHHIAIYDGIVKSRTFRGIVIGNSFMVRGFHSSFDDFIGEGEKTDLQFKFANKDWMEQSKKLIEIRNNFPLTEHRIENVKISAGDLAIAMKGGANIIKNNTIKVTDGGTASIYLFGPNQLIENNIIIFKGKTRTSNSSAAPIKIHAADGTIIRNNTIIIESSGEDVPQTAISIFDSKNVVIENNQIFGTKSVYKIWDEEDKDSSVIESGTTFPSFWKKPRPSF